MLFRSIASRLSLWVLAGSLVVLAIAGGLLFYLVSGEILRQAHGEATALAGEAGARIEQRLARVADTSRTLATAMATRSGDAEALLRDALARNTDLSGLAAAFVPAADNPPESPFVNRQDDGSLGWRDMRKDPKPYWEANWFRVGLHCAQGCWQRHFHSLSRRRELVNYSAVIQRDGQAIGLINADVSLDWLNLILGELRKPPGAYAFVLDEGGAYLAHDNPAMVGQRGDPALLRALAQPGTARVRLAIAQNPQAGGKPVWIYLFPVEGTHWSFGLAMPEAMIYAGVRQAFMRVLLLGLLALLAVAAITLLATRRTLAPLGTLATRAEQVARGALAFELPRARFPDEVGRLTHAFDRMRRELALHIAELTRNAKEQQRLASELDIAHQIQTALLPGEHYIDARCENFELRALLRPARAVGGDLYSYFMLGERRFCVMVGDVSDKGIPAALFMARTITLAKALAPRARSPQHLLAMLNLELCRHNENCMFVSLSCGMLDTSTGELVMSSAGHEPPVLCDADGARLLELETGAALGLDEDARYPARTLWLQPGQTLMLYTDGITEASDTDGQMFGVERLLACLRQAASCASAELADGLLAEVDRFAAGAAQADDITVLALNWHHALADGNAHMLDLTIEASMDEVFATLERCEASLRAQGVLPAVREDIRLVLEELMVNMVEHGRDDGLQHRIGLHLRRVEDAVVVELHHDGRPFDPLQAPAPNLTGDLADADVVGGLGIHLVRAMASELSYSHDEQGNHLLLRFLHPAPAESGHDIQPEH
ncbi:SpoIIE family protein phosphatase [Rhodanobacter sp. PCA2]|uniref:SpoIIE family protein phosphatase n=1 Tax=Rhodanobacter sp. PCA2 TaxID=2006117 RepID=UPI0015E7067E|nr:SpoIIE family protein phosphatase [Rhodanobacter sp. PCA2]MBA2079737.1 anti-anti-sigma factor [Rhodanobacter sp. PCA2]